MHSWSTSEGLYTNKQNKLEHLQKDVSAPVFFILMQLCSVSSSLNDKDGRVVHSLAHFHSTFYTDCSVQQLYRCVKSSVKPAWDTTWLGKHNLSWYEKTDALRAHHWVFNMCSGLLRVKFSANARCQMEVIRDSSEACSTASCQTPRLRFHQCLHQAAFCLRAKIILQALTAAFLLALHYQQLVRQSDPEPDCCNTWAAAAGS